MHAAPDVSAMPADLRRDLAEAATLAGDLAAAGRCVQLSPAGPGRRLRARLMGPGGLDAELALRDVVDPAALVRRGVLDAPGA